MMNSSYKEKGIPIIDSGIDAKAKNKNAQKKALLMAGTGLLLGTPFLLPFVILEQRKATLTKQEILDQAYRYAVLKFYLKYLELFME